MSEVYDFIPKETLLVDQGGEREHNAVEWVKFQISREMEDDFGSLSDCEGYNVRMSDEYEVNLDEFR